ncbi:MAG: sulfite exporter TauE/SafE family protein [Cytophagaceae bacterium]
MFKSITLLFLVLVLLAEILGTVGGFGSSVFFVPLASFFLDFHVVLGLTAIFHLSSNISKITLFRKALDKKLLLYIGLPSVLFVIIGGELSRLVNTKWLEIALSIFLIGLSMLFLIKKDLTIKPAAKESIIGGSLSGFFAGLLGTGGAIRGITMAAFNLEKGVFIATSATIDFGIDFTRTIVYLFNGYIHKEHLIYIPFLLAIGFAGTFIGKYLLKFIPQDKFKSISLILILIIGIITLGKVVFFNP